MGKFVYQPQYEHRTDIPIVKGNCPFICNRRHIGRRLSISYKAEFRKEGIDIKYSSCREFFKAGIRIRFLCPTFTVRYALGYSPFRKIAAQGIHLRDLSPDKQWPLEMVLNKIAPKPFDMVHEECSSLFLNRRGWRI